MKKRKIIITVIIVIALVLGIGLITYRTLNDENRLTSEEKKWINSNINNVQNLSVVKDANGFSKDGAGVFYDFINDFSEEYGIEINVVSNEDNKDDENNGFNYTKEVSKKEKIIYIDHYVLVSAKNNKIKDVNDLNGQVVGILGSDLDYVKSYLKDMNINFNSYDTIDDLLEASNEKSDYIILPRIKYLDTILSKELEIVYHLSDIKVYYTFKNIDDTFGNIVSKYLNKWEGLDTSLKTAEFNTFTKSLNITSTDIDKLKSVDYKYGFVNNSPYEVIMNGNYGGIISEYLQEFSEFSGVYFDITKYSNINKLVNAINKDDVDIYFDFNNLIESNYDITTNGINVSLSIVTNKDNSRTYNSIYSLNGETVYVLNGSVLHKYLSSIDNINIKTYDDNSELFKLNKEDCVIVMDTYNFNYYANNELDNYVNKYSTVFADTYNFEIKSDYAVLSKLLNKYIGYLDENEIINKGLNSHSDIVAHGKVLNKVAIYVIVAVSIVLLGGFIAFKKGKRIKIKKKFKKDEKIRFIDELTCLKNRSYLSDFLKTWSNNPIYPQTIIVVDLNKLKEINDKFGLEEGDKQIQAAANALIKTQLDNSDLIRSDGNEFVIYTVGYTQKQVINYIHKLNKEFKRLPYDFGAEFGYSVIEDNLKTVEDALADAILDMKSKKGENEK